MRKKFLMSICSLAILNLITTGSAFAAISGSLHDFSGYSFFGGETCVPCHAPHNTTSTIAPLWDHTESTATYKVYSSPSLNATVGQPSASSKACLSCHDGTVAIDSFGGKAGGIFFVARLDTLGADLSNDHPVSFSYNTDLANADGGLFDPSTKTVPGLGTKTIKDGLLIKGNVECSSCHDVHKSKGYSPSSQKMLIVNNEGSALCLTCHNK